MSKGLYLCAWAAEFPAQALLRVRTDWQTDAVVVMDGRAPQEWVCAMNRLAVQRGAALGMTRLEAESVAGLRLLKRSTESEATARVVFQECAAKFSPRMEEASCGDRFAEARPMGTGDPSAYALMLDIAGTERLFGPAQRLAERLREEMASAGFRVSVAVSANYDVARMKAAGIRGIAVIPDGAETEALAKLPLSALGLDEERAATFALWGIGTLGQLAALPEADLVARLGPEAQRWRALARGAAEHAFVPIEPAFSLEEFCEFEAPVEQIDSLLFVGARMIDCLVTRAAGRALGLTLLKAEMRLEGGVTHCVAIRPAVTSTDRKFLLKLMQLEIGTHPPQAAVVALTMRAEAGQQSKMQLGLFTPQTPEPSRLDVTLARLRALVGEERVGSPVLDDTHRVGGFHVEGFSIGGEGRAQIEEGPRMALRRVRPARTVRVLVSPEVSPRSPRPMDHAIPGPKIGTWGTPRSLLKPVSFCDGEHAYAIATAYGPWRTSGCWWAVDAWDTEEWDVLATANDGSSVACLLTCDRRRHAWRLEAIYD